MDESNRSLDWHRVADDRGRGLNSAATFATLTQTAPADAIIAVGGAALVEIMADVDLI